MRHDNCHALPLRRRMTDAEVILWSRLRRKTMHGMRIRRQHPIGAYVADFACLPLRLVIEIDGATHGAAEEIAYDKRREAYLQRHGFRVLRFLECRNIRKSGGGVASDLECHGSGNCTATQQVVSSRAAPVTFLLRALSFPPPRSDSEAGEVLRSKGGGA